MNLHINKEQFDVLMNSKLIGKFIIGSKLYGIDNDNSDTDYLIIYQPFKNQIFSAFTNHHQFQYKDVDNNIDYNFVDVITFVRNLTKGDSTINYELLYSEDFAKSKLGFLSEIKDKFKTYTILKSYLGFADRDARMLNQRKSTEDKLSGILHIYRSFLFAQNIYNDNFSLYLPELKEFKQNLNRVDIEYVKNIRNEIKLFRDNVVTKSLENKSIVRYLDVNVQSYIDKMLTKVLDINEEELDMSKFYDANEVIELKYE